MHFFLEGERGIGKSYLLRQQLKPYIGQLAGFAVSRLMEEGAMVGFSVSNVNACMPELEIAAAEPLANAFIYKGSRDIHVLEAMIAQVEADSRADWCRLILLDEIGGIELASQAFMHSLECILNCGKPCIGVWKSAINLSHTLQHQGLAGDYPKLHQKLETKLRMKGSLYTLTADNREPCELELIRYLAALQI